MISARHIDRAIARDAEHRALIAKVSAQSPRPFVPQGCEQQGRYEPTIQPAPAEACSELGAEPERKRRLGEPTARVLGLIAHQRRLPWAMFWALVAACAARFFWGAA